MNISKYILLLDKQKKMVYVKQEMVLSNVMRVNITITFL